MGARIQCSPAGQLLFLIHRGRVLMRPSSVVWLCQEIVREASCGAIGAHVQRSCCVRRMGQFAGQRACTLSSLVETVTDTLPVASWDCFPEVTAPSCWVSGAALCILGWMLYLSCAGRAGVPMEVMGLMLGEFVDDYTVKVVDVFAMPQSGTGVSVEAVDPVFQTKMLDMLRQTGRPEMVVGWYHSHPGFGCWLSGVDVNTQQSFEALNKRAVSIVVDPIQSVKGKVVIDAFRTIDPQAMVLAQEPRQTTSNVGHLHKPSIQALIHGLNRHYYSIAIAYRKNELEEHMLLNLHKKRWTDSLGVDDFVEHSDANAKTIESMLHLAKSYQAAVVEELKLSPEELAVARVGKLDAKKHLEADVAALMALNINQSLGTMLDTVVFRAE